MNFGLLPLHGTPADRGPDEDVSCLLPHSLEATPPMGQFSTYSILVIFAQHRRNVQDVSSDFLAARVARPEKSRSCCMSTRGPWTPI